MESVSERVFDRGEHSISCPNRSTAECRAPQYLLNTRFIGFQTGYFWEENNNLLPCLKCNPV